MIHKFVLLCVVLALPSLGFLFAQPSQGRQFAFLVACGDYDKTHLDPVPFTVAEMKLFRQVLIDSGVPDKNIVFLHDKAETFRFQPTRENILRQFKLLMERLKAEDSVVVALSGHGVQYKGDKFGYFCPIDAELGEKKKHKLLAMEGEDGLLTLLDQGKAGRKLLIVNACRNKPASNLALAAEKLQLADEYNEEAPRGTVMMLACKQGQFSWFYDDKEKRTERRNRSLFMYHLTEAWKGTYAKGKKVTVDHLIAEVSERVEGDAIADFNRNQIPLVKRKLEGQWELATTVAKYIDVDLGSGVKMKMVWIPAGKFMMGTPKEEIDRLKKVYKSNWFDNEGPRHEVEITKGFYLGKYEVTQGEYLAVMGGKNPSYFSADGLGKEKVTGKDTSQYPVEQVSWEDAKEFCRKLTARARKAGNLRQNGEYRLPTEAEWEYACRGGAKEYQSFHYGNSLTSRQANFYGNQLGGGDKGPYLERTTQVGSYKENAFGLHDMHGNVWEWCEDWFNENEYQRGACKDPKGPLKGSVRLFRGGGWNYSAEYCSASYRGWNVPDYSVKPLGFRLLAVP